jgi:hypothetical protein
VGEDVSCADHNVILFKIDSLAKCIKTTQHKAKHYLTKAENWGTFTQNLTKNLKENFNCPDSIGDGTESDNEISLKIKLHQNTGYVIQKFNSAITAACDTIFRVTKSGNLETKKRSVPWWTKDLTLLRRNAGYAA